MSRLLDDLLDASRIASGKLELRVERMALGEVIRQSIETARPQIDAARHSLAVNLPVPDVQLDGDPIRLAQVFSNLLNNAAKYAEAGGEIVVSATRREDVVDVTVRDNGIGIDAANLSRVFEMFGQVDAALCQDDEAARAGLAD